MGSSTSASWATPYAVSIYGGVVYPGGAGPSSDGYGDGRAISIGEVVHPVTGHRHELQLKGSGMATSGTFLGLLLAQSRVHTTHTVRIPWSPYCPC